MLSVHRDSPLVLHQARPHLRHIPQARRVLAEVAHQPRTRRRSSLSANRPRSRDARAAARTQSGRFGSLAGGVLGQPQTSPLRPITPSTSFAAAYDSALRSHDRQRTPNSRSLAQSARRGRPKASGRFENPSFRCDCEGVSAHRVKLQTCSTPIPPRASVQLSWPRPR